LRQEPLAARTARAAPHPPPNDRALPPAHQRQGGTLPPDDGARVGLRTQLPLTPRTQPGAATLARLLQHAKATQLATRTAANPPRSQPVQAGQLATAVRRGDTPRVRPPCP